MRVPASTRSRRSGAQASDAAAPGVGDGLASSSSPQAASRRAQATSRRETSRMRGNLEGVPAAPEQLAHRLAEVRGVERLADVALGAHAQAVELVPAPLPGGVQ